MVCGSCGRKPIESKETINTKSVSNNNVYFKNELQKSLAINDTFSYGLPYIFTGAQKVQDCDSLCNQKIKEALSNVNTSKQSGNNSYKIYYDKFKNQIVITTKLEETVNQQKDSLVSKDKQIEILKANKTTIPEPYIPTPVKWLSFFGILFIIYILYRITSFFKLKIPT